MSTSGQHDHQRPAVKSQVNGCDEVMEPYSYHERLLPILLLFLGLAC